MLYIYIKRSLKKSWLVIFPPLVAESSSENHVITKLIKSMDGSEVGSVDVGNSFRLFSHSLERFSGKQARKRLFWQQVKQINCCKLLVIEGKINVAREEESTKGLFFWTFWRNMDVSWTFFKAGLKPRRFNFILVIAIFPIIKSEKR